MSANFLRLIKTLFKAILIACFLLLLISFWGFYSAIYPIKINTPLNPTAFHVQAESIEIQTKDGLRLKGWFIPSKNPNAKTIILLHGYGADKGNILPSRLFLHEHFNLLFLDFRYFGQSEGTYSTIGISEVADIEAAIQYLQKKGIHEVGIWGISMGAATALMSAPDNKAIKAIVAESSYASLDLLAEQYFHLPGLQKILGKLMEFWSYLFLGYDVSVTSPMNAARKLTIPILLIHSKRDALIPIEHAQLLQRALEKNPHVQLFIVNDINHGGITPEMQKKIEAFFMQTL